MGAIPFSDDIKKARGAIDMWELLQRKRNGTRASSKKIRRLMRLTGRMTAFKETSSTIEGKRKAAQTAYNKLKKNASKLRENFGKRLIKARALDKKTTVEVQAKLLKQAFGQRAMAK